jgi:hypothetical protein
VGVKTSYKSVNGKVYTPEQRNKGDKLIKEAIADGSLKPLSQCACARCGQDEGIIHYHTEDYDSPVETVEPLCWRCHMMWHSRYRAPEAAFKYFTAVKDGKRFPAVHRHNFKVLKEEHGVN